MAVAGALLNVSKLSVVDEECRDRTGDLGDDAVLMPGFGVYVNVNPVA